MVVTRAEEELIARYGFLDEGELGLTAAAFDPPAGAFVVAVPRAGGPPVGGVGLRTVTPGTGEVKRLWVDPGWRGLGVGRALMTAIEVRAAAAGLTRLRLATGDRQPEAIALYTSSGWDRHDEDWGGGPINCGAVQFSKALTSP